MAKPKRQENKIYMGFDNEKVSPVRRPIPDFVFDNDYVTQRQKKHQPKPNAEAYDKHIPHEHGSIGTKSLISMFVSKLMIGQIQKKVCTWLYLFGDRHKGCWGTYL
jgi:hypothetical protein